MTCPSSSSHPAENSPEAQAGKPASCLQPVDFETALKRLEEIVKQLDTGDLTLDAMLKAYEEGMQLSRFCQTTLESAERKVEILKIKPDGTFDRVPFEEPKNNDPL